MPRRLSRPIPSIRALGRAVTRRARPETGETLRAALAGNPRDQAARLESQLGSREAARQIGVSERTLRRWRAGGTPSRANSRRVEAAARTEAVRRERAAAMSPRRRSRLANRGAYVRMAGRIGVSRAGRNYMRWREIGTGHDPIYLPADAMERIDNAWLAGDDATAIDELRQGLDRAYLSGIEFDDLTMLEFLRDDPSRG